jgi:serine/threonine protein kinase
MTAQPDNWLKGPSANVASHQRFSVGELLAGRFKITRFIAAGGMGEVYEAQDLELGEQVAIKAIHSEILDRPDSISQFKREVNLARKVTHPNVCRIFDLFRHKSNGAEANADAVFVSMELLHGRTLAETLDHDRRMTMERALPIVKQMAGALRAAHDVGIVHRDLKPGNVVLVQAKNSETVRAVVTDFGIARQSSSPTRGMNSTSSTSTNEGLVGTPAYMAPEQLFGRPATAASDIYALGLVIYEMVTGVRPFQSETGVPNSSLMQRVQGSPPSPRNFAPDLNSVWEKVILQCLEHDPAKRFPNAEAVSAALSMESSDPATASFSTDRTFSGFLPPFTPDTAIHEVVLLYKRNSSPDEQLLGVLENRLRSLGYHVFVDRHLRVGMEWAREIEQKIAKADAVIVLLSAASITSEMLAYEIEIAHEASERRNGKPRLLPVRLNFDGSLPDPMARILDQIQQAHWRGAGDSDALIAQLHSALKEPADWRPRAVKLEAVGGAVPLDSEFYIVRPTDEEFKAAIARNDSIVLVKGARQMGKTSLLARGLHEARGLGCKVIHTDFQQLNTAHLESVDKFLLALGEAIADELGLNIDFDEVWNTRRGGPSMNFARFLKREVLDKLSCRLVWGMDEVDRLFTCNFGSEVFGLFRSWHNARSLDPSAPWHKLTLALAYATEAHMFITDMNQSPFNVGTRLALEDFTLEQVSELNRRYGSPLPSVAVLKQFYDLLGGQPYLTRRGLHELTSHNLSFAEFTSQAARDEGPFGDHLRRILVSLAQDQALCDVIRKLLSGRSSSTLDAFYRLRSAGVVSGETAREMRPRCHLYQIYLAQHLL